MMTTSIPVLEEFKEDKVTTVVADDLEIKGTIKFKTSVMLKGIFEGEIISEGLLVIGQTAKVTATISTRTLISYGEINGNVTAEKQCVLKNTATHNGDLKTPFLAIENGAVFNGAAIMERRESETFHEEAAEAVPEATEALQTVDEVQTEAGQAESRPIGDPPDEQARSFAFGRNKRQHDKVVSIDGSAPVEEAKFSSDDFQE